MHWENSALTYADLVKAMESCKPDPSLVTKFVASRSTLDRLFRLFRSIGVPETHDALGALTGIPFIPDDDVYGGFIECHNCEGYVIKVLMLGDNRVFELPHPRRVRRLKQQ